MDRKWSQAITQRSQSKGLKMSEHERKRLIDSAQRRLRSLREALELLNQYDPEVPAGTYPDAISCGLDDLAFYLTKKASKDRSKFH